MIILEWLTTYLSTSKMDMTFEIELFGMFAILIITGVIFAVLFLICVIAEYIKYIRKKHILKKHILKKKKRSENP